MKSKIEHIIPLKFFTVLSFILISTYSFPQWRQSSKGIYGGNVSAFHVDTISGFMYASCGGVIMSKDNGNTWKAIDSSLVFDSHLINYSITMSLYMNMAGWPRLFKRNYRISAAGRYVYSIATRGKYLLIGTSAGVYASPDTGRTWISRNDGLIGKWPMIVFSFAFNGTETYIGTKNGLFFSPDTGRHWVHKSWSGTITDLVCIGDNLLAGTQGSGIYLSKDKGNTWTESKVARPYGRSPNYLLSNYIQEFETDGSRIFAATESGIFLSRDSGRTWQQKVPGQRYSRVSSISIKDDLILASTEVGDSAKLFMSEDEGNSWSKINFPAGVVGNTAYDYVTSWNENVPSQGVFDIFMYNNDFFMGTDFGFLRSTDRGISWQYSNNGIMKLGVTAMCKSGNNYFAGTSVGGIFVSKDNGETWTEANNGLEDRERPILGASARYITSLAASDGRIYAGTPLSGIFCSSDSGSSWSEARYGLSSLSIRSLIALGNNKILAGTDTGIYITNDRGYSWTRITKSFTNIKGIAVSGNNIYCTAPYPNIPVGVFMSDNGGSSWQDISGNIRQLLRGSFHDADLNFIEVLGNTLIVGTEFQGIFKSDDNGNTWKHANVGLRTDNAGKMILSLFSIGSIIYAGTGAGVYMSSDKGENWIPVNEGIPIEGVQYLGVIDSFMFAGTVMDGLWKRSLSDFPEIPADTTGSNPINVEYLKLTGISIYPNPFEDEITINFNDLSDEEYVAEVLNIAGTVLLKTQVKRTQNKISLEGIDYHGFCILKIMDSKGRIKGIQKIIRL